MKTLGLKLQLECSARDIAQRSERRPLAQPRATIYQHLNMNADEEPDLAQAFALDYQIMRCSLIFQKALETFTDAAGAELETTDA